jgi:hypothetical protein
VKVNIFEATALILAIILDSPFVSPLVLLYFGGKWCLKLLEAASMAG